ncbi:hypothetical protein Alches_25940 [Alicyclobacillus hesperidum subsp. aegles]|uniref:hypothetical protein n=1 Tax=Alicyclobacillus TaxID=29330 RepID=UPI001196BBA7|nr:MULTISPECIES: hypothetical protein [Alicyclobacillus]GEO27492.1 hypothetical protein AAC03nite_32770 [Alicyclobacillus acidoterrestris]GLG02553.1 hypothetical protein Alches_25940 [Alicyclobacillus hesperidum subsp. aegles]
MGRPKKFPAARRDDQIVVYVQKIVGDALRREAEVRGVSVSTLAADILQEWIESGGVRINISEDTLYAVMRKLAAEGLLKDSILDAKFAPKSKRPQDEDSPKYAYPQPSVDNPVDSDVDKSSANLSPKTSPVTSTGAKAKEQQSDKVRTNVTPKAKRQIVD